MIVQIKDAITGRIIEYKTITREEANEIIRGNIMSKSMDQLVICYRAQWYDIRTVEEADLDFVTMDIMKRGQRPDPTEQEDEDAAA